MITHSSPARNSILIRSQNFGKHGRVENEEASERPVVSFDQEKTVSFISFDTQAGYYGEQSKM